MGREMSFDFDTPLQLRGTNCTKYDAIKRSFGVDDPDIIPMWVADMDFRSPPAVIKALQQRVAHGVFGYTLTPESLTTTVVEKLESDFSWSIEPEWLVWLPGLVTGFNVACRAVGEDNDDVMTAVPVYPPFLIAPQNSRRHLIKVPLQETDNHWAFDFDLLEKEISPNHAHGLRPPGKSDNAQHAAIFALQPT